MKTEMLAGDGCERLLRTDGDARSLSRTRDVKRREPLGDAGRIDGNDVHRCGVCCQDVRKAVPEEWIRGCLEQTERKRALTLCH